MLSLTAAKVGTKTKGLQVFPESQCRPGKSQSDITNSELSPNVKNCGCGTTVAVAHDGGIDGIAYFLKDRDENGKAIFQVKSRPGNRGDLATLNSDRQREKADFGFLICTSLPTKPMRDEIAAAGKYKHPLLDREDDRLQVITVAELFAPHNVWLNLPMARADAVKTAAAKGDADKQIDLL